MSAIREYDVRDYDAEATHKDYLIGDISHIGATRLGRVLINAQIAARYALILRLRHLWYLVTSTSGYGCPKNGTHPLYIPGQILVATAAESRLTDYQANGATDLLSLHGD